LMLHVVLMYLELKSPIAASLLAALTMLFPLFLRMVYSVRQTVYNGQQRLLIKV